MAKPGGGCVRTPRVGPRWENHTDLKVGEHRFSRVQPRNLDDNRAEALQQVQAWLEGADVDVIESLMHWLALN